MSSWLPSKSLWTPWAAWLSVLGRATATWRYIASSLVKKGSLQWPNIFLVYINCPKNDPALWRFVLHIPRPKHETFLVATVEGETSQDISQDARVDQLHTLGMNAFPPWMLGILKKWAKKTYGIRFTSLSATIWKQWELIDSSTNGTEYFSTIFETTTRWALTHRYKWDYKL